MTAPVEEPVKIDMEAAYKEYKNALAAYELDKATYDLELDYYQKLLETQKAYMENSLKKLSLEFVLASIVEYIKIMRRG